MSKINIGPEEARFNAIMNSRLELTAKQVGTPVRCKVSGNPTTIFDERIPGLRPTDAPGALKDLYSFNVSKATVLDSAWFNENHAKAIALEAAGQADQARELFNKLMNASQLSFGIINRDGMAKTFVKDQMVDVVIGLAEVEEKDDAGKPTGKKHQALVATSMSPVEAVVLTKRARFGANVEETPVAPVTAPAETVAEIAQP